MARALSHLAGEIVKLREGQDTLLRSLSSEWQLPDLPQGQHDVALQLSFALADSTGVLDKALVVIPMTGMKSPTGLPRAGTQAEEADQTLFMRPLMDSIGSAIVGWCESAQRAGLPVLMSERKDDMMLETGEGDDPSQ